ncbi:MAG: phage tail protein [Anaeromicrobium sp.]|jgi:phage tail-like protein|uniref:phage tail protein n=1 Tax=Anaeromicrobium sp. TaxID=1929132 RepID=UPI0025F8A92F|nr:phage tail protein [Anaeromicrobium sp.]MCT4593108.1 phage tail protein [Anaeromicrobium sp.]
MSDRKDPIRNFRYKVSVGGAEAGFSEVTGFEISIDTIEYREGDDPTTPYKLPGLSKYSNITLKHGVTDDMELYNWIKDCVEGKVERKVVTIIALGEDGSPLATWEIVEAWPVKYTAPDFNSTGSEVAIESMELAHEGLKRTA